MSAQPLKSAKTGSRETLEKVDPWASGNIATWLAPRRELQLLIDRAAAALAPVLELAPQEITAHASTQDREVVLRGLPFARWNDGRVYFDVGGTWEELRKQNEVELKQLVLNQQNFRNPLASETRRPLFRAIGTLAAVHCLARRHPRRCLTPARAGVRTGVGAERRAARNPGSSWHHPRRPPRHSGIEETAEALDLPLQAGDYCSRIRRHQEAGDLARYGYFPGVQLQPAPPLVYLIAPALRFYPSTDVLLEFLRPEMKVIRIGLAESWTRGLRVMMRQ